MSAIDIVLTHRLAAITFASKENKLDGGKTYEFPLNDAKIAVFCPACQPSSVRAFGSSLGYKEGTTEYDQLFVFRIKAFLGVYRIGQADLFVDCTLEPPAEIHGETFTAMRLSLHQ